MQPKSQTSYAWTLKIGDELWTTARVLIPLRDNMHLISTSSHPITMLLCRDMDAAPTPCAVASCKYELHDSIKSSSVQASQQQTSSYLALSTSHSDTADVSAGFGRSLYCSSNQP